MQYLTIKNWKNHQHYKDRDPPWIKLHRSLLNDYTFLRLQDASKLHLILIWLFASQSGGRIPNDTKFIQQRIGCSSPPNLKVLIESGFLIVEQDASKTLADCKQSAMPETETETETEAYKEETEAKRESEEKVSPKGSRLTTETLPLDWKTFACKERPDLNPEGVFQGFRDYWLSAAGSKGIKADWFATWRNWIRNQHGSAGGVNKQVALETRNRAAAAQALGDLQNG